MCPDVPDSRPSLASLVGDAGATTVLLTDEPRIARHPLATDFDDIVEIDLPWQSQTAEDVPHTHFGRCFVEVIERLESLQRPFLLWCHLGGLGTTWDAPLKFRHAYRDGGDPPPPDGADVPEQNLPADYNPDELLGIAQAYSGQITLLDTCLGALMDLFDTLSGRDETLLTLTSARGFPLGEHRRIGPCDEALHGELVHVPWMVRFPDAAGAAVRSQALVEPSDLWATLLDWWNVEGAPASPTAESLLRLTDGDVPSWRDRLAILGAGGERAIRTPAWYLRAGERPELFAKPDDRWEVNDVASRCQDVTELLLEALAGYESALRTGQRGGLPPLADVLLSGLE